MTIILDPGNQAESYNTTVRQWRQSSGLWKTDYGTSQSALSSSQAALATMTTNYNNSQAALTSMTNDRNYWKTTVAHDDAAVWDNRYNVGYSAGNTAGYNTGYAAADVAESPRALSKYTFTATISGANPGSHQPCTLSGTGASGILTNNGGSLTAHRAGYWSIYFVSSGYNNVTSRIYTEGVLRSDQGGTPNAPDWLAGIGAGWVGFVNAGGLLTFTGRAGTGGWNGTIEVTFVPTPGYQQ